MRSRTEPRRQASPADGDLGRLLDDLGLGQYAAVFAANDVTLAELVLLSDQDLTELGLSLGHRRRLAAALAQRGLSGNQKAAAPTQDAERRQLTIMFCDLVESMALSERLDPEDLREVISGYQDTCAGVIERFEGVVAKFMGDGILAYFGYPQAHEDDAERAVRAGLEITAALDRAIAQARQPLRARIGIATGAVVVGDIVGEKTSERHAVVGETPNLAARLQTLAGPNQVIISDATRRLVEGRFDLADLGPQSVKGFSRTARAFAVVAERMAETRFDASRAADLTTFVGRERELSLLRERWSKAAGGTGQVVLLSGEAGIGKSRVVRKLLDDLAEVSHARLRYQCSPLHINSPLHPVIRQIETACAIAAEDPVDTKIESLAAWLGESGHLLPYFATLLALPAAGRFAEVNLAAQKAQVLAAILDVLATQARRSPVLLVLEDAHWIDASSLELLKALIERIGTMPALLIVSFRPPFDRLPAHGPHLTSLDLERLGDAEVMALIAGVAGPRVLPPHQMVQIVEKTDGVPLFVEELTRMLLDSNAQAPSSDRDGAPHAPPLPMSLHDLLMARLDQLAPARRVAQIAAVVGREFSYDILSDVAALPAAALGDCLNQLLGAGLITTSRSQPAGRFAFKHALVRDAAYTTLLKRDRRQLHAAVATVMQERPARFSLEPEVLAHHCDEGGLTELAVRHWAVAARRALQRAANTEALSIASRALETVSSLPYTPERSRQELDLLIIAGGAYWLIKGFGASEVEQTFTRARQVAESVGDTARLTLALRGLIVCHYVRGELSVARPLAEELLALARQINSSADLMWTHTVLGAILLGQSELRRSRAELETALAMHDPIEQSAKTVSSQLDPGIFARASLGPTLWMLGYPDQALAVGARAIETARAIGQPFSLALSLCHQTMVRLLRGEIEAARALASELRMVTTENRIAFYAAYADLQEGTIRIADGETEAGIECLEQGLARFRAQQAGIWVPWASSMLAVGHFRAGRAAQALRKLDDGRAAAERGGQRNWDAELHRLRAEFLASSAKPDLVAAEAALREAVRVARDQGSRSLQLRALLTLARLHDGRGGPNIARNELAVLHATFTEGRDTADLQEAKRYLESTAASA
jgi:class 3 adenylate cyclase